MRQFLLRFIRLLGLVGIFALSSVVALNVFLNTGLHVLLNLQPHRVQITWTAAWMFYPGEVEVWDLGVRAQDAETQWILAVDHAEGVIDLAALLDYRFVATGLRGEGGTFSLRARRTSPPASADLMALPPIPGLQNPPSPSPEVLYGPPKRLFHIELSDLVVEHVREVWIEDYRFVGDARLTGGLDVLNKVTLELPQSVMEIASGALSVNGEPIASDLGGRIEFALAQSNPAALAPLAVLERLTARALVTAQVQDIRFLDFYLRNATWLKLRGGEGPVEFDISLHEGRVLQGSRLGLNSRRLAAHFLSYTVTGDANVRLEVVALEGAPEAQLAVEFFDYAIAREGDIAAHARGTGLRVLASTRSLSLTDPFETLTVSLEIPESVIPDASVYTAYLPSELGFTLTGGSGKLRGELRVSTEDNIATGDLHLDAFAVGARLGDVRLGGDVALHAHLTEGNLGTGVYDISGTELSLTSVRVVDGQHARPSADDSQEWWAKVRLPRAIVTIGAPEFLDATLTLSCRDSVPFVTLFSQANPIPGWARGLLHIRGLTGETHIRLGDDSLYIPRLALRGRETELHLKLRRRGLAFQGSLLARYRGLAFGFELLGQESKLHLFPSRQWYDQQPSP